MRHLYVLTGLTALFAALLFTGCDDSKQASPTKPAASADATAAGSNKAAPLDRTTFMAFSALPKTMAREGTPSTEAMVTLGRMLFFDKRLSKADDISCNTCHGLETYGVDGKPTSSGHEGQLGSRNSPTVYNAALHMAQFWDGRAKDVEEQAGGPVLNPVEMAMKDEASVVKKLEGIAGYVEAFEKAFPKAKAPVTYENMTLAIGAYERKLLTPSKWDDFLEGQDDALSPAAQAGATLFVTTGCASCHNGPLLGGNSYRKLGEVKPYPGLKDEGLGAISKDEAQKFFFKVPSLRNIDKTGPYFHDGSVKTLEEAVKKMAVHQLGKTLKDDEVASLVTFLQTLTGPLPSELIAEPKLP